MIELYFITALVLTTNTIPTGWLQWTSSFPNKELCQEAVEKDKADIVFAVGNYFKKNKISRRKKPLIATKILRVLF